MRESCSRLNNPDSAYKTVDIIYDAVSAMTAPVILPSAEDSNIEEEDEEFYTRLKQVISEYESDSDELDESDEDFENKLHRLIDKMSDNLKKLSELFIL